MDDLDWAALGAELDMSGADIKSAAVAAAFLARSQDTRIGMRHVLAACRRELEKRQIVVRPGQLEIVRHQARHEVGGSMDVRIDTLRLRVAGIGADAAQQLASLMAERLSGALPDIASARPAVLGGRAGQAGCHAARPRRGQPGRHGRRRGDRGTSRHLSLRHGCRRRRRGEHRMSGPLSQGSPGRLPADVGQPAPVITAFQYNPEKMVHTWSQAEPAGKPGVEAGNPLAVAGHARRDVPAHHLARRRR